MYSSCPFTNHGGRYGRIKPCSRSHSHAVSQDGKKSLTLRRNGLRLTMQHRLAHTLLLEALCADALHLVTRLKFRESLSVESGNECLI